MRRVRDCVISSLEKKKDEAACAALAGRLETWFMKYKASWRSISKEGDLHHIAEIVFWYAMIFCGEENRTKNKKSVCKQNEQKKRINER